MTTDVPQTRPAAFLNTIPSVEPRSTRSPQSGVVGLVLAGGRGARLHPLTQARNKAAVEFGGGFRLIDFVLSNLVNSGIRTIGVLNQFDNGPLLDHLDEHWRLEDFGPRAASVTALPGRLNLGESWYHGTADAVYRNLDFIAASGARDVAIFAADHVCRMDIRPMLRRRAAMRAAAMVSALPVPLDEARRFGVIETDSHGRIIAFHEKPAEPPEIPGRPGWALASMGNYVFGAEALGEALEADAVEPGSEHDFGRNVLPWIIRRRRVYAYDFRTHVVAGATPDAQGYWRDVGTVPAYYQASMEALPGDRRLGLFNPKWPLRISVDSAPKTTTSIAEDPGRNSLVSQDCLMDRGFVADSVVGREVQIGRGAEVRESILMEGSQVGAWAKIRRIILGPGASIPAGCEIESGDDEPVRYVSRLDAMAVGRELRPTAIAVA